MEITPITTGAGPVEPGDFQRPKNVAQAATQFEALLLTQMLKQAHGEDSGWLGAGEDSESSSYMDMADQFLAQALAARGGLGLSETIRKSLDK